jgi:FkbM family methyltransferase
MPKTLNSLAEANQAILTRAAESSLRTMTIQQLRSQPAYCGFVECQLLDRTFLMLLVNGDDGVALRWLWNRVYEGRTLALWAALAKRSRFIYDIGAHTGVYTIVARIVNPTAMTMAFEPNMINYARLLTNLRANDIDPSDAYHMALSDVEGTVPFSVPAQPWYHSSGGTVGQRTGVPANPVTAMTVDGLVRRRPHQVDLAKIDTEGHEARVLNGMRGALKSGPDLILESVHADSALVCTGLLAGEGYRFYVIDEEAASLTPVGDLSPLTRDGKPDHPRINRLVTRRGRDEIGAIAAEAGLSIR